tara:strand:- start:224 stop:376 length:153 start_codon:yes stop_codon:yes gene_type:complete
MTNEDALKVITQLANEVPLKGSDAALRIEALKLIAAALSRTDDNLVTDAQ